jgi:exopolysaccharide biosynthesis polyprenyl glycosylphosphotransferase
MTTQDASIRTAETGCTGASFRLNRITDSGHGEQQTMDTARPTFVKNSIPARTAVPDSAVSVDRVEFPEGAKLFPRKLRSWMLVTPVDVMTIMLPAWWAPQHLKALGCLTVLGLALLTNGRPYRTWLHISVLDELPFLLTRLLAAAAVVATVTALRHEKEAVTSFLMVVVWVLLMFVAGRVVTMHIVVFGRCRRIVAHRTLLVGGGALSAELAAIITRYPQYGLIVIGFVDDEPNLNPVMRIPWLGHIRNLDAIACRHRIDTILVAGKTDGDEQLLDVIRRRPTGDYRLMVVPRLHQFHIRHGLPDHIGAIPVMHIDNPSFSGLTWAVKRMVDVVASASALLILAPLLALLAVAVRIEGGPGVIFRQERIRTDGRTFECMKFRTMRPADPDESATRWSITGDPRMGKVGRFLRRSCLDELPQLWNILRGDMTLVGPRPERPHFVGKFAVEIPSYQYRHRVRGGLTGLAQVSSLRGDTPITDRARFDNYYIENWSLWMDLKIILRTFREVLFGKAR